VIDTKNLEKLLNKYDSPVVFVHSDLYRANIYIKRSIDRQGILDSHIKLLRQVAGIRKLWFPAFNYQFTKTHTFNPDTAVCEVGPLPEHFRQHYANWRTLDPVFSICGGTWYNMQPFLFTSAFGTDSIFAKLVEQKAAILFYGASFSSATIIHYAEQLPLYRYDKIFQGTVTGYHTNYYVEYLYHVRPMGYELEYDWPRLLTDLQTAGLISNGNAVYIVRADQLVHYWSERLKDDPYYLLDAQSRKWVEPMVERLCRRFELTDFEVEK
jgi:aminoglycoside 3-N-acetyltransferase